MDPKIYIREARRDYLSSILSEKTLPGDPLLLFEAWFQEAVKLDLPDANAMTLATVSADSRPCARVVLLRHYDEKGFIFFSNYESDKARHIRSNNKVALTFFWPQTDKQIRVEGKAKKTPGSVSDDYFRTRPRESQIGAWASDQSRKISGREELEQKFLTYSRMYEKSAVPRPPFWGGYVVSPLVIEFWQGREKRLHDRIVYRRTKKNSWSVYRLAP